MAKYSTYYFLIFFLIIPAFVNAQTDTIRIKEVPVIGYKNRPVEVSVKADSVLISTFQNNSLNELVSFMPSVSVKNYGQGSISTISLRGTGANHTQLLWNGISLNSPLLGQADLSQIPVFLTDEMQVFYGGNSILNSNGGIGGSLLLNNNPCWNDSEILSLTQEVASFQTFGTSLAFKYNDSCNFIRSRLYYRSSDNSFPYLNDAILPNEQTFQRNASFNHYGFLQEYYYRNNKGIVFTLKYWHNQLFRNIPPIMTNAATANYTETQTDISERAIASIEKNLDKISLRYALGGAVSKLDYCIDHGAEFLSLTDVNSNSRSSQLFNDFLLIYHPFRKTKLSLSAKDEFWDAAYFNYSENLFDVTRNNLDFLAGIEQEILSRFIFSAFYKQSLTDDKTNPPSPYAGLNYFPTKNKRLKLKANVSGNFRMPSLNDLYFVPGGNPDLLPERGYNSELGISYESKKQNFNIGGNVFYSEINDWIQWKPSYYGYWVPENIDEAQIKGAELMLKESKRIGKILFSLLTNYSYTISQKMNEPEHKQMIYIPKNSCNALLNVKYLRWNLNYTFQFTGLRNTALGNSGSYYSELPPYSLHNVSVSYGFNIKNYEFTFKTGLNNILNTNYQVVAWRAMPGINYFCSLNIRYK